MSLHRRGFWLLLLFTVWSGTLARAGSIWVEGEAAISRTVKKHGWYDAVEKSGMSGKDWISHYDPKPGTATYAFQAPEAGSYTFWWRGNTFAAQVGYRLNTEPNREIDFADKRGEVMVSATPDHRFLAWVKVGKVDLKQGRNTITFTFHGDLANHGGIDCFLFDNSGFLPSGTTRPPAPGAVTRGGVDEWFPVVFDDDTFSPKSVTDMSSLIEAPAGKHGFLRRDGEHLKFADAAAPVQFWGCGANMKGSQFTHQQMSQRARYLRKHGVDMIRQHTVFDEIGPLKDGKLDPARLDAFDWWCAELKKNGIYMTWSVFYGDRVGPDADYPPDLLAELGPADPSNGTRSSYGLVNVEPKLQEAQLRYLKAVMLHTNPYTKLRPVDDPALAVVEFQNEDSIFFHFPLGDLAGGTKWPQHSQRLRQKFAAWAKEKYKTEASLRQAWGGPLAGDDWGKGELALMAPYHLGGEGPRYEMSGQTRRAGDYIRFLAGLQRGFYERRESELRQMGYKAVTVTTAWRSGGAAADPANLWCDTAADMIDRHNYLGGGVGGHGIAVGKVDAQSHLPQPGIGLLSIGLYQVENRPFSTTEWTQLPPNPWKLEAAPLMAFYGMGLQGWDASYHFASHLTRPGDGWPSMHSYVTDTPHFIGQFPALAFAIKKHHIQEAPIIAARRLKPDALFTGTDPLRQDFNGGTYDAKALKGPLATPVEALAIGRVTVGFDGGTPITRDLKPYWDRTAKVVKSVTGELVWDYGKQVVTVRSPKTQAILGRAGDVKEFDLPGVRVLVETPFVSLIFTPLDDLPLLQSRHILITAMARDAQTGTQYSPDDTQLLQAGGPPLIMEPVRATIALKGTKPTVVNVLDVSGVPTGKTVPIAARGTFALSGEYRTYSYEVKR